MSAVHTTDANFENDVLQSDVPVIVDFWAAWCAPCRVIAPVLEEISEKYKGRLKVVKLNVDENQVMAMKYGIMSIPNLKFFKGGEVVDEIVGALPRQILEQKVEANI